MKKKGFTLIELLAVLVILAIIALIITPIVTNLIKDARIKSAENATEGLLEAVHVYYGRQVMLNNGVFNDNKKQTVEFDGATGGNSTGTVDGDTAIEFNGFKITDGSLTINRYGKVQIKSNDQLVVNGYYCINNGNKAYCDETEINPEDVGVYVTAAEMLTENVVTSGDGLYADSMKEDKYVYRGGDPDNYILFNNEIWRILSISSTGEIKIIKDSPIDLTDYMYQSSKPYLGYYDDGIRSGGYCSGNNGCNAWSSLSNYDNGNYSGAVDNDSAINIYLNSIYKSKIGSDYQYVMTNSVFNIGPVAYNYPFTSSSIVEDQENAYTWVGDIALLSISEYLNSNSNESCYISTGVSMTNSNCGATSFITKANFNDHIVLLNSRRDSNNLQWAIPSTMDSDYVSYNVKTTFAVLPVLYLKSTVILEGNGTNDSNIYKIVGLAE